MNHTCGNCMMWQRIDSLRGQCHALHWDDELGKKKKPSENVPESGGTKCPQFKAIDID